MRVFPEWMDDLPMQQQSVMLLAARGPDGVAKFHPCKHVVRAYRATVLKAALYGRLMNWGEKGDNFMCLQTFSSVEWFTAVKNYCTAVDELPHHYHLHLMHGAQIIGCKHPDPRFKHRWLHFYCTCCDDMHLRIESETELDARLNDWNQEHWAKEGGQG